MLDEKKELDKILNSLEYFFDPTKTTNIRILRLYEFSRILIRRAYQAAIEQTIKEKDIRCLKCRREIVFEEYGLKDTDF